MVAVVAAEHTPTADPPLLPPILLAPLLRRRRQSAAGTGAGDCVRFEFPGSG